MQHGRYTIQRLLQTVADMTIMKNSWMRNDREKYEVRFGTGEQLHHYKLVVRTDGSFAAKCLETDQYVAGYDITNPSLSIREAALRVYGIRYGEFYTLFLRCTSSHLEEQIRKEYERIQKMLSGTAGKMPAEFPAGSICGGIV